ncbi:MAG: DUF1646 family protein [Chloroflexi bacterium]|nr:DUF1646 family protein [Chloroflexota bacterium]
MSDSLTITLLGAIFLVVLALPFLVKRVEHNLEAFLFLMGVLAVTASQAWDLQLVKDAARHPVMITGAVLGAGALAHLGRERLDQGLRSLLTRVPLGVLVAALVAALGLVSSVITAIIAGILLAEFLSILPLSRGSRVNVAVLGCFAIGLGAALTPVGEPLSTIAVQKLSGEPHRADFFFLARLLGIEILVGIAAATLLSALFVARRHETAGETGGSKGEEHGEAWATVGTRALKVYVFVAALTLLGAGYEIVIEKYLSQVPGYVLFWANMSSAVLDNATLTAAEIGPSLSLGQIEDALLALIIAGIMLIPGNIPNIIVAGKLHISMRDWARLGVPLGLGAMLAGFLAVVLL